MKLFDVLVAFASLSLLLLIGMALRQRLRWLRQLGIPEALVAGLLDCWWARLAHFQFFLSRSTRFGGKHLAC